MEQKPPTLIVEATISMGHRLPNYDGRCSSPHGHNMRVEVEVESREFFLDFKHVSEELHKILDPMDHAMILSHEDELAGVLRSMGFRVVTLDFDPTTEEVARYILNRMAGVFSYDIGVGHVTRVTVHETAKYSATVSRRSPYDVSNC